MEVVFYVYLESNITVFVWCSWRCYSSRCWQLSR